MNCSSELGVIAGSKEPRTCRADVASPPRIAPPLLRGSRAGAGAGALPGARRRCEAGTRTYGRATRTCLALLAATALLALAAPAQAQTEVWSATLTTGDLGSSILGCSNDVGTARCSSTSVLSEDSFTYDSTAYNITGLFVRSNGQLEFIVDVDLTTTTLADLTLVVGSTSLVLSGGTTSGTVKLVFSSSGVSLTAGTDIAVKLTAPGTPNTAAMGAPTITGTAQVGKTLTAVTTGITDADGLTSPTFTYQWIRVDGTDEEDISGENSSTYTLDAADLGKTIKVRVTFTDDASNSETLTSAATATVAADTTPPEVVSVTVASTGSDVYLVFDEGLDGTAGAALPSSAFSLTVAGQAVTIHNYNFHEAEMTLTVQSGTIKQGQTVVVSYTDPTAGDDTVALQDSAGNDVASFTTGMSGVPAVTNDSTVVNTAPTAANNTVTTGEDRAYTFTAADFGFADTDAGAALASVKIVTPPALGTLALDGTAVLADGVVTKAQIDGDMLTFTPARDAHGVAYTTFTFKVNDGTVDSADAYTMTIDVTDAPAPVCAAPSYGGRRQIWTGTVTVERIEHPLSVFYGFSEVRSAGTLLPSQSFSIGSNSYSIDGIVVTTSVSLAFSLDEFDQLTDIENAALRLHVCDVDYDFNTSSGVSDRTDTIWPTTLDWSDPVVTRTVYLSLPANNDATGEPAITGTVRAEQVLTATTGTIADDDGLPSSFTYQWLRVDADGTDEEDISGENSSTYTLDAADVGKKVKVKVSFTDELSGEETRTSAAYPSSGTVTVAGPNTAPTAANNTVTTGEDRPYAFMAGDFGFADTDTGDTLASVKIVTPPALGTLALDGTAVSADDVVTKAQIDGDMLTFTPVLNAHGDPYTTFTFKVNDGTVDSASAYTMTIYVTDAPAPVCAAPSFGDRREIWSGTVTVGTYTFLASTLYGYSSTAPAGALDDQTFTIGSNDYTIARARVALGGSNSGQLAFELLDGQRLTTVEVEALRLHVCDTVVYNFSGATTLNASYWSTTLDWSPPVVTRTLYLSLPANHPATGEPAITGTAQAGQELTADASPIMDTDGLTGVDFTYQWLRVDADGMSNPADITDATAATYSLTAADAGKKIKVKVSFTDELSGKEERTSAAYPSSGTVTAASTAAPALTSVTVTSTPHKTTDTYGAREHIEFSMTFDAPVTVTGDPTFAFDLGGASTASYYAGSGTATLRFSHAVTGGTSGDRDTNGISWAENAIVLNGGTIAGRDNAVVAVLTHAAQSNLAGHKVDGRTTAVTPATVTDVVVTSTPMLMASGSSTADTYGFGETIVITVTVSEAVEVEGDPVFRFSLTNPGSAANNPQATYDRTRSIATTIVFTYTVQAGDMDNNGIWIGTHSQTFSLDANDRIRTASQQIDIDRSHLEKGTQGGHKVDGSLGAPTVPPDPTAPTLVSATATTLTIEWTHPGDGGSPLTRNFIEYRVEGTTDWTNWYRGETPTSVTRTVITNLAAATAYDVRVHSTNAIGNSQWVQSATAFSTLAGTAATGAPTITGTAAVGQTLAVDLTGIADADGLTNVSYSYQWVRVDADGTSNPADIAAATDATYTLDDADLGTTLKVRVTFDDDDGNTETLTSAATATVTPVAGAPASPTNLSATVGVGQVVLVWQHPPAGGITRSHYEYRSSAGDMIAPDAMWQQVQSSSTRPIQSYSQVVKGLTNDTTHTLQVRAVNPQGGSAPATVTATPVSQSSCTIDALGDRRLLWQGQLTAGILEVSTDGNVRTGYGVGGTDPGTLTPDAFTFRSTSYSFYIRTYDDLLTVVLRDPDFTVWYPREAVVDALRVHVCNTPYDFSSAAVADLFLEFEGYQWNVGFNWPPGIERTLRLSLPPNHPATGDPVISGTVQVGEELTALTDGIMDDDVLDDVFTYQWVRVDADGTSNEEDITDETDATYTLTADERGKKVKVEVRFVDILGGEETRTSAPTATLAGVPNTAATGAPTITGTAQVGQTLTASTTGIADANGLTTPNYTYQWIRVDGTDEADIAGENSSTYILGDADLGTTLKVRVTFADDLGHTETLTSAATATVGVTATAPTVSTVEVTSMPASGTTYYLAGEVIEFTVTFSAPVTVTATPKFAFRLGAATRQAAYESGSDSTALVFARTVQAGEVDRNGISWNAIALALDGGTITQTGATTAASLTHAEQANLEGHRVDAAPPMQVSASVQGLALVLVYDEPLDPASMPATGAYTVTATVGATTTNPAVSEVSIYGIWVTLTLDAAPAVGATVTLAYAPPASNPVQDEAGNDAPAFSGQSVRLGPPPPTPDLAQVMGVTVVPGNAQLVVTWTAVDNATGYTVQWKSGGQAYNTGDRQATVTSGSTTSHTITGLANGTEYTVRVIATRTGANDGPPSDEMTGTPTVPTAAGITVSTAALTVTEQDSTGDGYTVVLDTEPTADVVVTVAGHVGTDVTANPTALTFTMSNWETAQTVTVTADDDADTTDDSVALTHSAASADSGYSGIAIAGVAVTVTDNDTAQVTGVGVVPGNAQLVVTWTAVDNATGYTVQWTSGGQGYNSGDRQATVTSGTTTSHTITGLANGTEYTVQVIATRTGANDGPPSDEMTGTPFTTPPPPVTDLAQVLGVSVTPGNAQLVVTWTAVDTATGYTVQWKSGGQGYNTTNRQATVTTGSTTSHTITGLANGTEYTVRVSATRTGANDGPPSDEMTGTPTVPTAAGIAVSTAALTVTEQDSTGDGYTVVLDTEPTADVVVTVAGHAGTDVTANPTALTFTMSNWETAQTVTVTADDDADTTDDSVALTHSAASADSGYSGIAIAGVAVTVNDNDTAQVMGVGVAPGNAQLVVTWTAVDNATGYTVQWTSGSQGYNSGDRQATVTSGSTTSHTITGLANGTEYTVQVIATRTGANDGPPSDEMTGTPFTTPPPPPPPVTDLEQVLGVSVTPGNAQLVVTWTAVSTATGYTVQWKSGGQGYNTTNRQATVTSGTTTSHAITGLANGTEYTVQVSATRTGANDGPPSDEMTGTPTVPTAAGITVSTAGLTVTEQDSTGDGYTVVLDTEPTADVVVTVAGHAGTDVTANPTALTFTMSNWETAQTVTVTAGNDADTTDDSVALTHSAASADSGYSGIAIAGVAVTVNDNDTAQVMGVGVAPGNAQLVVTWTAVDNATGYTVQWTSGSQGYNSGDRQATVTSGSTTSHTITGLANGTEYTVQVIATRTGANDGPPSDEMTGTPFTTPPPPSVTDLEQVLGVSVTPGNAQLVVTWSAVDTAMGYTVQWTSSGQGYNSGDRQATVTSGSTTSHTITGLANGTEYTVRVIATRTSANDGPPSAEVTASPVTTPGAPQHLSAVPGYEQVTLTWDAPSSDGGSAILRYEYAVDDSGTWIDAGLDLEETVTGLTNGQRYTFAVRAVNAAGTGPAATVTIVTSNPLPQAWLARFGRAATDHVVDAVSSRWQGGPQASHLTIGGGQTGALFGWIGRVGQAARDTADDRGDPVRTETSWTRLFAPSGGPGTGGGGTGPGMTVTDRNTGPVGLGGVDRKAGAPLSGRAAQGALLGALGLPDPRALTDLRAALLGSSFFYSGAGDEDGQPRTPGRFGEWSAWGRGAASWFSGTDSGLSLDGEVVTAMLGLDSRWERWLAGVVVSHSRGQGTYRHPTATGGAVASSLTALHPYAGYKFNERTSIWGVLGYGVGEMSLTPERSVTALETGLMNAMAAVGGRMALSVRSGPAKRFELAIRSDARLTNTAADGVGAMAGAAGQTHRVRMMLEGSGVMPLASGGVLKPRLEAGLRYDAGDAETGAGLEVGGGLGYAFGRLSLEVNARGLLAHRDTQYEEWGFSGAVDYTPSEDGRGVSLRLGSGWGATQSGVQSLWRRQDASDLVRHAEFDAAQRYQVELRYGLDGLKGRVRWTPYIGVDSGGGSSQALRLGVTLTSGRRFDAGLELGRRQGGPGAGPEHAGQIRVTLLW